jgi:hypothetical protein
MPDFVLTQPPVREDPKGPLMECKSAKCMMVLRRDDCRLGNDGELVCPYCGRQMKRYHAAYESLKK